MAKSLFFNALPDTSYETGYDRNYNADDLSDFLSIICDTGVVKTNTNNGEAQGLKVTASGRTVSVATGKAVIKGKAFINDAIATFTAGANGTTATRYDLVVLRFDNSVGVRNISLELRTGASTKPTASNLTRSETIYELLIAYVAIAPSASAVTIEDTRGDAELCPWFTAVTGYDNYYDAIIQRHESTVTTDSLTNTVITDISSKLYNERYSLVEVYTNGIKEPQTAYKASASAGYIVITFTAQKAVGSKITVILNNFIDGEGMTTALAQYNALVEKVADFETAGEYNYICNGVNDNIVLSNIVREFYSTDDYSSLKINVIGKVGITGAFSGTGTSADALIWFNFISPSFTNRIATVDFSRASAISPPVVGGKSNVIFRTNKINIVGANVFASKTEVNTVIRVSNASSGAIKYENCRFWITAYQDSYIALHGTFTNCRGFVANAINNSYCFSASYSDSFVKLNGGEYYAYTGSTSAQSAIVGQSGADAVCILYGVSAPTSERAGYYQTNSLLQWVGGGELRCTDLISALPMIVVAGIAEIRGTITKSKSNVV